MIARSVGTRDAYLRELREFISAGEGFSPNVYLDTQGIPTIGYGYNLRANRNNYVSDFESAGIVLTQEQQILLSTILNTNTPNLEQYNSSPISLNITEEQATSLYDIIISRYENDVLRQLDSATQIRLADTYELIALVSMVYNGGAGMIGPGIRTALNSGDRVAAWYEIRYASNRERNNGVQNRRVSESDLFGLYDNQNNININEAKQTIRYLENRRDTITSYLSQIRTTNNSRFADNDLNEKLTPAINLLVNEFANGKINANDIINNNGKILVGQGIGAMSENYADYSRNLNDTIIGTNANDLIFGGRGFDTINAGNGDDVIYSSSTAIDDDNSSDILKGGKGYDTYHAGDKDIIEDSDGKGEVYFNNTQLIGGILDKDKSSNSIKVYLSEDKNIEYHLDENSKVLKVIDKNNNNAELTINNFNKEEKSLNINLADNLGKEVAIVIDTTGSMWDDIETTKSKALTIAKNIFRENSSKDLAQSNTFSKISIVTFSDNNIKTIGTYYNYNSFQSGINSVNIENGGTEYHCAAMIEGMSNFTKDNGLDKQIFLMTDESGDDNHRMDEVIAMANNFGKEMTTFTRMMSSFTNSSKIIYDNSVKINVISINSNLSHLKRLSDETGGLFLQPNSLNELEDALFDASNLGTNKSETIIGNNKNNIIEGKGGNDILQGKEGSDTYIFKDKFDKDIIIETNKNNIDKNKIDLSSFSIKDAKFKVDNNDLTITIIDTKKDSFITALDKISHNITKFLDLNFTEFKNINIKDSIKGSITIKEFFNKDEFKISTIKFSDYTIDETTLNSLSKNRVDNIEILNNSFINPFKSNLIISNEDIVKATLKDDIVVANKDNQTIISNLGNDTLITNKNNNTLIGENGDDTYIIGKDANNTIIRDKEYVNLVDGGNDTLILNDIDKSSVEFKLGGSFNKDLIINYSNSHSKDIKTLTIQNQTNKYSAIENINLDGAMLGAETINKIIQDLNSYGDDKGLSLNFNSEFKNNDIMQVYNS